MRTFALGILWVATIGYLIYIRGKARYDHILKTKDEWDRERRAREEFGLYGGPWRWKA